MHSGVGAGVEGDAVDEVGVRVVFEVDAAVCELAPGGFGEEFFGGVAEGFLCDVGLEGWGGVLVAWYCMWGCGETHLVATNGSPSDTVANRTLIEYIPVFLWVRME